MTPTATASPRTGPATDGALARAYLAGRPEAFARLYERFFARLVAYCVHRAVDAATAEDLAQDALLRALDALDGFDTDAPMWPWLKQITSNLVVDHGRKHGRCEPTGLIDEPLENASEARWSDGDATPDFTDELAERWLIDSLLRRIPIRQAASLELCYLDGWSQHEAAELLSTSGNAFKQLVFRARSTLAEVYERASSDPCAPRPCRAGTGGSLTPNSG